MIAAILAPIILVVAMFSMVGSSFRDLSSGGNVRYNEEAFQDYADQQYAAEFGSSTAYEDNLLITVLIEENHSSYYYIAWVGDHIATDINLMMGNAYTALGSAMNSAINTSSYKYSLDSNLAQVMNLLTQQVQKLGLESSFTCSEDHIQVSSHLTNHTDLSLTEGTVNDALTAFTDATGIPVVIVVEDAADVFARSVSAGSVVVVLIVAVAVIALIVVIVKNARRKENNVDDRDRTDRRYRDFDDQY